MRNKSTFRRGWQRVSARSGWLSAGAIAGFAMALPAAAAPVAFEDEAVLASGHWQLNTILGLYPLSQEVIAGQVSALASDRSTLLTLGSQEIRYGLTDWLLLRTTVPLAWLRDSGGTTIGLGDWEFFAKARIMGDDEAPFALSASLQTICPTSLPGFFSVNGGYNLVPTVCVRANIGPGCWIGSLGYLYALERATDQGRIKPSDSLLCSTAFCLDLADNVNVALSVLGSQGFASRTDGAADPNSLTQQLSLGPDLSWKLNDTVSLLFSLQVPVLRTGNFAASSPLTGMGMVSVNF